MNNFLEDELSKAHLGLSAGARSHLERFRSFLQQYYVEKFGYWPPRKQSRFPKLVYKSMYFDFHGLYDYLADSTSSAALEPQRLASGGICVLQNLQAFDQRHQYMPLPHPLPLLPESIDEVKVKSQRSLLAMALRSRSSLANRQYSARTALHNATNISDLAIVNAPLVKAYRHFERECANMRKEEKVSLADARKVRWILIYCILQTLISVTRAPKEVRDAELPEYPLCCTASCVPPWEDDVDTVASPVSPMTTQLPDFTRPLTGSSLNLDLNGMPTSTQSLPTKSSFEIHPDCETDTGYFGKSRSNSTQSLASLLQASEAPTATTSSTAAPAVRRTSSKTSQRSIKALSFTGFGSRRNSIVVPPPPPTAFCEIIVHGYGNGTNPPIVNEKSSSRPATAVPSSTSTSLQVNGSALTDADCIVRPLQPRPRPVSAYTLSNNSSTSTIIAPQPLRPMSAHEKKSFKFNDELTHLHADFSQLNQRARTREMSQSEKSEIMAIREAQPSASSKGNSAASSETHTPVSVSDATDSDREVSPVWSLRRGSASSQSSTEVLPLEPEKEMYSRDVATYSEPHLGVELRDVGGLLHRSETANSAHRGILVHRTFSVERFKVSGKQKGSSSKSPSNGQAVRRVRDQAFAAAQKLKRRSVRYTDEVDLKTILNNGPNATHGV